MITRRHQGDGVASVAVYSACGAYRYSLTRDWGAGSRLLYVMLNPSTATEAQNDPTVERCERRARALGCGAFAVVNLFAFRATDPRALRRAPDPVGAKNDTALGRAVDWTDRVICAWGNHGGHLGRSAQVRERLAQAGKPLLHLGLTAQGEPRHPLYVGYAVEPQPWV